MARELEYHDELGLVEVVKNHQKVELVDLQNDVIAKQSELEQAVANRDALNEQINTANEDVAAKEAALADSKSILDRGTELVDANTSVEQPESDVSGSEATEGVETSEAVEIPVYVETPSF